jgi:hypothetical protein
MDEWTAFPVAPHATTSDRYDDHLVLVTVKVRVDSSNWRSEISGFAGPHHAFTLTEAGNACRLQKN